MLGRALLVMGTRHKQTVVRIALAMSLALTSAAATFTLAPTPARAAKAKIKKHKVYKGQTLGKDRQALPHQRGGPLRGQRDRSRTDPIKPGQRLWIPPQSDEHGKQTRAAREKAEGRGDAEPKKPAGKKAEDDAAPEAPSRKAARGGGPMARDPQGPEARQHRASLSRLGGRADPRQTGSTERKPIQPGQLLIIPHRDDEGGRVARALRDAGAKPPAAKPPTAKSPAKGAKPSKLAAKPKNSWDPYVKKPPRPRYVTIVGRHDRGWKGTAVTKRGNARSYARKHIAEVLATRGGKTKPSTSVSSSSSPRSAIPSADEPFAS